MTEAINDPHKIRRTPENEPVQAGAPENPFYM